MPRRFNTAGPNDPEDHYTLPVLARLPDVRRLVDEKQYFVLHAPRQAGKTTALLTLARELTREGRYVAVLVSMESGVPFRDDIGMTEDAVIDAWRGAAERRLPADLQPPPWPAAPAGRRISRAMQAWTEAAPRPLVVFVDEIDALEDEALVSALRQLRDGYPDRPRHFPWSLALIGMRDVRDYKMAARPGGHAGSASPFNVKSDSLTLLDFTREEIASLYGQHTAETGQVFLPEAVDRAFALTQGQPWLVNALARQLVEVVVPGRATAIDAAAVDAARDILIRRQDTHLDSLAERLREPRLRAIIEPMLAGEALGDVPDDDLRFAQDLGLVRMTADGGLDVANPIYREIIVRSLSSSPRASLPQIPATWLTPAGRLDEQRLLAAFLAFWKQHGEPLLGAAPYHEVAPHLVLMAFLHRVVNGGSIEREYAIGRGRMDLCLKHGPDTLAIEIKVWPPGRVDPLEEGLKQLDGYLARLGLGSGWLVLFDRRPGIGPIAERVETFDAVTAGGRTVRVVRA
jgi:hypothetical protein